MSTTENVKQLGREAERYLGDEKATSRKSEEVLQLAKDLLTVEESERGGLLTYWDVATKHALPLR